MNVVCSICTECALPNEEVCANTCGHVFHKSCLLPWIEISRTCPVCRKICIQSCIHRIYFTVEEKSDRQQEQDAQLEKLTLEYSKVFEKTKILEEEIQNLENKHKKLALKHLSAMAEAQNSLQQNEQNAQILRDKNRFLKKENCKLHQQLESMRSEIQKDKDAEKMKHKSRRLPPFTESSEDDDRIVHSYNLRSRSAASTHQETPKAILGDISNRSDIGKNPRKRINSENIPSHSKASTTNHSNSSSNRNQPKKSKK